MTGGHAANLVEVRRTQWPGVRDVGRVACLSCARETIRSYWPGSVEDRPQFGQPEDLIGLLAPLLAGRDREQCLLLTLDVRHRLIDLTQVSVGSLDHTFMSPREIYRDALLQGAAAIVVAHTHPSGDAEPSAADRAVTKRLAQAGRTIGVALLDHLVLGSETAWTSLAREGVV